MNGTMALMTGVSLGLAYFGGLWWTVSATLQTPRGRAWIAVSRLVRFLLCAVVFYALGRQGLGLLLAAVAGFWIARWHLLRRLGGTAHGN